MSRREVDPPRRETGGKLDEYILKKYFYHMFTQKKTNFEYLDFYIFLRRVNFFKILRFLTLVIIIITLIMGD